MEKQTDLDAPDEDDAAYEAVLRMAKKNFVPSRLVPFGDHLWNFYVHSYHHGNATVN